MDSRSHPGARSGVEPGDGGRASGAVRTAAGRAGLEHRHGRHRHHGTQLPRRRQAVRLRLRAAGAGPLRGGDGPRSDLSGDRRRYGGHTLGRPAKRGAGRHHAPHRQPAGDHLRPGVLAGPGPAPLRDQPRHLCRGTARRRPGVAREVPGRDVRRRPHDPAGDAEPRHPDRPARRWRSGHGPGRGGPLRHRPARTRPARGRGRVPGSRRRRRRPAPRAALHPADSGVPLRSDAAREEGREGRLGRQRHHERRG